MKVYEITILKEGGNKKFPSFYKITLDKLYAGMV